MAKFRSPFNTNEIWLSQTYHGESASNPDDLSKQCAVDLSKEAGSNVFSVCNGTVELVTTGGGSYVSIIPDGANFRILYVHIDKFTVSKGQKVSKGQVIGKIRTLSSGSHLHFGLKNISGKAPHPQPMDYFDRSLVFRTKYKAIKDIWFKGENLNWDLFKDLSYENTTMKYKIGDVIQFTGEQNIRQGSGTSFPVISVAHIGDVATIIDGPRTADGYTWYDFRFDRGGTGWCADVNKWEIFVKPPKPPAPLSDTECEKEIDRLKTQIGALEATTETQGRELDLLSSENSLLRRNLEKSDAELIQTKSELHEMNLKYNALIEAHNRIVQEKNEAIEKLKEGEVLGQEKFISKIGDWVKGVLAKILGGRS